VITVVLNDMVVRITEQASFFEILWVMRVLRFIMNFSDIRAGLRGAGRVVCWVAFCGLVAYDVSSLARRQSSSRNGPLITLLTPATLA